MELVHLASSNDDLYTGYDEFRPNYLDSQFSGLVASHHLMSSQGRTSTAVVFRNGTGVDTGGTSRPMTSIRAVGYSSRGNREQGAFDPLSSASRLSGRHSILDDKEDIPEEKIQQLERKVNELVEQSCLALSEKDHKLALERAKEAAQKERILLKQREHARSADQPNLDLSFIVLFNLANQYAANEMFSEALGTYQIIMRNRMFQNAGRLKVNMGNIYVKLGQYSKAIKFYRMALDQVPNTHKRLRIKIMQNIGVLFVKMGKYSDAITSFEYIMGESPEFKTGLNLILCFYALGDKDKMKKSFKKLVDTKADVDNDEEKHSLAMSGLHLDVISDVIKDDSLQKVKQSKKQEAEWCILMAAKLISPVIDNTLAAGFAWCVDIIKGSVYTELANELEINKAVTFLKQKEFTLAIEALQGFEKKTDAKVASTASTNLCFLYLLQNDTEQANKYADMALNADHYNPGALVNKGCCLYLQGEWHKAWHYFKEALVNEATCIEAMFNLGLSLSQIGHHEDAFDCFKKLHTVLPNQPCVIYHLASLCGHLQDKDEALEWYQQLLSLVPTDPGVLQKMADLFEKQGDRQQAFQYYSDSYRYFPSKTEVAAWLGAFYVNAEVYEKAVVYFDRAVLMQPNDVKWYLMIASCYRRSGNYRRALQIYKIIHHRFPDNIECLKFLVRLCTDMGLPDVTEYAKLLAKTVQMDVKQPHYTSPSAVQHYSGQGFFQEESDMHDGVKNVDQGIDGKYSFNDGVNYKDPLGVKVERPRTSALVGNSLFEDGFNNEELGDDLLP